jgi:tRNA-splicing ligase RtcB (3'-phosphate/5'-hydroxy nucleic acid ligase)
MDPTRFTRLEATVWRIDPHGSMRVPVIIYADEDLIRAWTTRSTNRP